MGDQNDGRSGVEDVPDGGEALIESSVVDDPPRIRIDWRVDVDS